MKITRYNLNNISGFKMKQIVPYLRWFAAIMVFFTAALSVHAGPAPDFELPTDAGPVSLQAMRGRVVYLDFWASWCKPCRKSFPWMNALQAKYRDKGLQIIAVNIDSDPEQVKRFLEKYPADFIVAYDAEGKVAKQYQVKGMPSSYLIDKQGNIHAEHVGFREEDKARVETQINYLLKN
jgi:cytochrome c biogenesis protein CcmG/thiol:disulfide interchange protein DsbE